jgi:Fe-S-cluster formation regulator IscX/YfhJ
MTVKKSICKDLKDQSWRVGHDRIIYSTNNRLICTLPHFQDDGIENECNGRLIASAPNMLFELEELIKKFKLRKSLNTELNEEACLIFKNDLNRIKNIIRYVKKG